MVEGGHVEQVEVKANRVNHGRVLVILQLDDDDGEWHDDNVEPGDDDGYDAHNNIDEGNDDDIKQIKIKACQDLVTFSFW